MPTYEYKREDGEVIEIEQSIKDPPLTKCPETGLTIERQIAQTSPPKLKGKGFYCNDYRKING